MAKAEMGTVGNRKVWEGARRLTSFRFFFLSFFSLLLSILAFLFTSREHFDRFSHNLRKCETNIHSIFYNDKSNKTHLHR